MSQEPPTPPEVAKQLFWLVHHLKQNWRHLTKPSVLVVGGLAVFLSYQLGKRESGAELQIKEERLKFANDQVAAYKDRLQGASPDQAAKQIATLQSRLEISEKKLQALAPDDWRVLSEKEKESLLSRKDELKEIKLPISVFASPLGDSSYYALSFIEFFDENQIPAVPLTYSACPQKEHGVMVGLKTPEKPSASATKFTEILKSAGLKITHTKWHSPPSDGELDFNLFICPQ